MFAAPAAADERSDEQLIDAFARIAFGNEFERVADPRLAKWVQPVRYAMFGAAALEDGDREFLDRHMARLAALTKLDMRPALERDGANFRVLFVNQADYREAIDRQLSASRKHLLPRFAATNCIGLLRRHRATHAIEIATVIIPVDSARLKGLLGACIAEETTQVLGLLNDSDELPDSLFNDRGEARDLTPLDELLLRILYHPKLGPGMRPDEALGAAREVLPEIRREAARATLP